jgi:hypothetical protein
MAIVSCCLLTPSPEDFVTTDFAPTSSTVQLDGILKYSGISLALAVWLSSYFLSEVE